MKQNVKEDLAKGITKSFYNSNDWKEKKEAILVRDNYCCQRCLGKWKGKGDQIKKPRLITSNDTRLEVHHIVELKDDPSKCLDDDNLITLCHHCHDVQHNRVTKWFNKNKAKKKLSGIETDERW